MAGTEAGCGPPGSTRARDASAGAGTVARRTPGIFEPSAQYTVTRCVPASASARSTTNACAPPADAGTGVTGEVTIAMSSLMRPSWRPELGIVTSTPPHGCSPGRGIRPELHRPCEAGREETT